MKLLILTIFLLLISVITYAETIEYQIYEIDENDQQILLAEGEKEYQHSDIKTKERGPGQTIYYLPLEKEFSIGVVVTAEEKITGFDLAATYLM